MDVKALADAEDFERMDAGREANLIGAILTEIDPDMSIERDLLSANVIEGHKEKLYLIRLKSKQAASRLLAVARESGVQFKSLGPSRTRMEREKYRKEWEMRQKEGGSKGKNEREEAVTKKTRTNNVHYFNPKPIKLNDTEGATATPNDNKETNE